ncbi:MAG: peptidylprolyl isomerase [Deltaproteobacteria bacterium]|jgi:peptidyl-prolyl cis-trans isomerase C|nr:peptidylprolyl isomerase [Deltaproteobacteria bacterium]
MRKNFGLRLWTAVLVLSLAILSWPVSAEEKPGSDKVAVVNGDVITRTDLEHAVDFGKRQAMQQGKPLNEEQLGALEKETLDKLIGIELLYQASVKAGNKVDDKQVDEKFAQFKKRFPNDEALKKTMEEWHVTEADMKAELKKGMVTEAFVVKNFVDKTTVPEAEVKAYYDSHPQFFKQPEKVKASHILIKVKPDATEAEKAEAMKKIDKAQEKLKKGDDFAEVAKTSSEGPSASKGGDLGYFGRGQMVKPFEDVAFSLEPGKVSDVVKTQFGYHLIKVVDKKPESTIPFETVKPRIEQFLKQQEVQKEVKKYIDNLRKDAKVEIFLKNAS